MVAITATSPYNLSGFSIYNRKDMVTPISDQNLLAAHHAQTLMRMIRVSSQHGPHPEILQSVLLLAHLEAAGLTATDISCLARTALSYARHMESGAFAATTPDEQREAVLVPELTPARAHASNNPRPRSRSNEKSADPSSVR